MQFWRHECRDAVLDYMRATNKMINAITSTLLKGLGVELDESTMTQIEIPPVEGALIINVGDTLEILSNGRYKSVEHRVIASSTKARVSVLIFVNPGSSTVIGPLPGLPEKDGKTVYRKLMVGEYYAYYYEANHLCKKTLEYAKFTKEK
ncbi:hypothetical protein MRB53_032356 [Persea americana]|uniref:Uncharacterized protein n=1 Tax=Persea americana TaxID=3435 RepID=A0ACC2KSK6_PERAE|nr:hypothetical protein MRB53_032356 [Persea americana]